MSQKNDKRNQKKTQKDDRERNITKLKKIRKKAKRLRERDMIIKEMSRNVNEINNHNLRKIIKRKKYQS